MKIKTSVCVLMILLFISSNLLYSDVKLPRLISDGLVLQRDVPMKIWGWADAGETVKIAFLDKVYKTTADADGEWEIVLSKIKAGGPYEMTIQGNNVLSLQNILIGDVWICSGQSNMELTMKRVSPLYGDEIANSENSYIRYFEVPDKYNFGAPQKDLVAGEWIEANPDNIYRFSAVSYFFGKELYDQYNIPIGLINAALGGSPAESWISEEGIKAFSNHYEEILKFKDGTLEQKIRKDDQERISGWYRKSRQMDAGYSNAEMPWHHPDYQPEDWLTMKIPGLWPADSLGPVNGTFWFRKEFDVPASMAGKAARLNMGRIIDADSVYVNGVFTGTTSYQYPPRRYQIPENVLKEGKNIIVVRVVSSWGRGGFVKDKPYELIVDDQVIDLKGEWQYKLGAQMPPLRGQTFIRWKPVGLFNAMIATLLNVQMKGVIWYQGESNAGRPDEYKTLFPAMIKDWRKQWQQGDFPFLFVQLPNFMKAEPEPSDGGWARFREAQTSALSLLNTGMAVAIDIGEWNDIHPLNKKDVGHRLSLLARKKAYKEKRVVYSGPVYQSMKIKKDKIILSFDHVGSGLMVKDEDSLKQFAIAGADSQFVWANAEIKGKRVVVWSEDIKSPVAVRYAWANNPEGANLFNKEGLPAAPFRTDQF